jgi:thiosulfate/3-mercaptopyruvate sulfurtransferase
MAAYYDTLVSVDTCMRRRVESDWRLIDCRFDLADKQRGETDYRESHIPGAHYAHLEGDLSGVVCPDSGRHPLPDWRDFSRRLARWGIAPNTQVVAYDGGSGAFAARLWWLLRTVGHARVAVLDGGWAAWCAAGGPVDAVQPAAGTRRVTAVPVGGWVTTSQVEQNLRDRKFVLVDARGARRFAGLEEPIDPVAGHVPGARSFPFERNLDGNGLFLGPAGLRSRWLAFLRGCRPGDIVHMCGSGVTACHSLLAMEHAGLTGSRLYVGSWSEWVREPGRPVETGSG